MPTNEDTKSDLSTTNYDILISIKARNGRYDGSTHRLQLKDVPREQLATADNVMVLKLIEDFEKS